MIPQFCSVYLFTTCNHLGIIINIPWISKWYEQIERLQKSSKEQIIFIILDGNHSRTFRFSAANVCLHSVVNIADRRKMFIAKLFRIKCKFQIFNRISNNLYRTWVICNQTCPLSHPKNKLISDKRQQINDVINKYDKASCDVIDTMYQ